MLKKNYGVTVPAGSYILFVVLQGGVKCLPYRFRAANYERENEDVAVGILLVGRHVPSIQPSVHVVTVL